MGWRFYRRVRLLPGVHVNLSRSGPSLTVGVRGAHVTVGRRGVTRTVGLPGSGIFYTTRDGWHGGAHTHAFTQADPSTAPVVHWRPWRRVAVILLVVMALAAWLLWLSVRP